MSASTITVCDACGRAACWRGELMCEDAPFAGTREAPVLRCPTRKAARPNRDSKPLGRASTGESRGDSQGGGVPAVASRLSCSPEDYAARAELGQNSGERLRVLETELAALRAVPRGEPGESVCCDDDCPFPEHLGECPPPSPEQWEHLARIRGSHIGALHRRVEHGREALWQAVEALKAKSAERAALLATDTPWPLAKVLEILAEVADHHAGIRTIGSVARSSPEEIERARAAARRLAAVARGGK